MDDAEVELDKDFFRKNYQKVKLNKGEKRALKFALKSGENLNDVDDLKTYLGSKVKVSKNTHNTPLSAAGMQGKKYVRKTQKTNDYKQLEEFQDP